MRNLGLISLVLVTLLASSGCRDTTTASGSGTDVVTICLDLDQQSPGVWAATNNCRFTIFAFVIVSAGEDKFSLQSGQTVIKRYGDTVIINAGACRGNTPQTDGRTDSFRCS